MNAISKKGAATSRGLRKVLRRLEDRRSGVRKQERLLAAFFERLDVPLEGLQTCSRDERVAKKLCDIVRDEVRKGLSVMVATQRSLGKLQLDYKALADDVLTVNAQGLAEVERIRVTSRGASSTAAAPRPAGEGACDLRRAGLGSAVVGSIVPVAEQAEETA